MGHSRAATCPAAGFAGRRAPARPRAASWARLPGAVRCPPRARSFGLNRGATRRAGGGRLVSPPMRCCVDLGVLMSAMTSALLFNLQNSYLFIGSSKNSKLYIHFDQRDKLFAMVSFVSSFEIGFTCEN